jgi:hypothetical protein
LKTSWSIGLVFLFVLLQYLVSIAEGASTLLGNVGGYTVAGQQSLLLGVNGVDANSNVLVQAYSLVSNCWSYCVRFINMLTWNYPTFFQGNFVYLKPFFIAISIGFVFSIVSLLRGVHSS